MSYKIEQIYRIKMQTSKNKNIYFGYQQILKNKIKELRAFIWTEVFEKMKKTAVLELKIHQDLE
jgi:hypothetical protein